MMVTRDPYEQTGVAGFCRDSVGRLYLREAIGTVYSGSHLCAGHGWSVFSCGSLDLPAQAANQVLIHVRIAYIFYFDKRLKTDHLSFLRIWRYDSPVDESPHQACMGDMYPVFAGSPFRRGVWKRFGQIVRPQSSTVHSCSHSTRERHSSGE